MELAEIGKIVGEAGILLACAIVIVWIASIVVTGFKKWLDIKLEKEKSESREKVSEAHAEGFKTRIKITPEVKSVLRDVLLQTQASRAYVFEFHNGAVSLGGLPFVFMSCTYEELGKTATSQKHARQQMPIMLYDSLVLKLIKEDIVRVDNRTRTGDFDLLVYETLEKRGTLLLIGTKLLDEGRRAIGFLGIDYCAENLDTTMLKDDEETMQKIENIVYKEAQVLSTLLYVKVTQEVKENA